VSDAAELALTTDRLLGGRVVLTQPATGTLRAGLDPVLLAAAIPAVPGERVLEAGCGTGAAFLCLAARVPGLGVVAVERDPILAGLAQANGAANGLGPDRLAVHTGDVTAAGLGARLGPAAHGFANPPWWPGGTAPPAARRRAATHAAAALDLAAWAGFLAAGVVPGGTVTLILPAARVDAGLAALAAAGCGAARLLPLWPRAGVAAKRVLLQARRGRRGPARVEPGLVLHGPGQGFTPEAEAILRAATALPG
jgi:tRNA1Val (adenine37-N6)-methyltransferase